MATNKYQVDLRVGSAFGFRRPGRNALLEEPIIHGDYPAGSTVLTVSTTTNIRVGSKPASKFPILTGKLFGDNTYVSVVAPFQVTLSEGTIKSINSGTTATFLITRGGQFIESPFPLATTTVFLNGNTSSFELFYSPSIKFYSYTTFTDFISYPFQYSNSQTFYITNNSLSTITFGNASTLGFPFVPSFIGVTPEISALDTERDAFNRVIISPGNTASFSIKYYGESVGVFNNYFSIFSDVAGAPPKVLTRQIVLTTASFTIDPGNFSTTSNTIGDTNSVAYRLQPIINNTTVNETFVYNTSIDPALPWQIIKNENNEIVLRFRNNDVNNQNGTYTSNLTIEFEGYIYTATNTCTVAIDYDLNKNLGTWISPKAPDNSVIGFSYDLVAGAKTLTIGVGTGDETEGVPEYAFGGNAYLDIRGIGPGSDKLDVPFPHWKEVYRINNLGTGTARTIFSGEINNDNIFVYKVKPADVDTGKVYPPYGKYFGDQESHGSLFIIHDDGQGNLRISLNQLREYSTSTALNRTLDNLTRAFHYYSEADVPARIENIPQYPLMAATTSTIPWPLGETRTNLFLGFQERFERKRVAELIGTGTVRLYNNDNLVVGWKVRGPGFSGTQSVTSLSGTDTVVLNAPPDVTPLTTGSVLTFFDSNKYYPYTSIVAFPK